MFQRVVLNCKMSEWLPVKAGVQKHLGIYLDVKLNFNYQNYPKR